MLIISHNLNDVFEVADRIAVLYLGRWPEGPVSEFDTQSAVAGHHHRKGRLATTEQIETAYHGFDLDTHHRGPDPDGSDGDRSRQSLRHEETLEAATQRSTATRSASTSRPGSSGSATATAACCRSSAD